MGTFQSKVGSKTSKKKVLHSVPSTASLYGTDVAIEEHRLLVDSIARHIIYGEFDFSNVLKLCKISQRPNESWMFCKINVTFVYLVLSN